jgi:hypothetical protein
VEYFSSRAASELRFLPPRSDYFERIRSWF